MQQQAYKRRDLTSSGPQGKGRDRSRCVRSLSGAGHWARTRKSGAARNWDKGGNGNEMTTIGDRREGGQVD